MGLLPVPSMDVEYFSFSTISSLFMDPRENTYLPSLHQSFCIWFITSPLLARFCLSPQSSTLAHWKKLKEEWICISLVLQIFNDVILNFCVQLQLEELRSLKVADGDKQKDGLWRTPRNLLQAVITNSRICLSEHFYAIDHRKEKLSIYWIQNVIHQLFPNFPCCDQLNSSVNCLQNFPWKIPNLFIYLFCFPHSNCWCCKTRSFPCILDVVLSQVEECSNVPNQREGKAK